MAVKAKRFRIGVEGATTDGRNIERAWLEQMAASYDPQVYTPGNQAIRWARRSLLVIFLAFTGHVITLAFYLLTLVALKVLRAQVVDAEPVTV